MKFESLRKEWQKDSVINENYDIELVNISKLHSKYFGVLCDERRHFKITEIEYNRLKKIKREYYLGRLPRKFLTKKGWDPIDYEIRPSDIGDYLKGDIDLCKIEGKMALLDIKIEFLKDIIRAIHNRGFHIKTVVEWIKFKNGEM